MKQCPHWTHLKTYQATERQKVIVCLRKLARYSTRVLRPDEVRYEDEWPRERSDYSSTDKLSALLLMNRYVFDVHNVLLRRDARLFGGWAGVPITEKEINLLWPLVVGKSGSLELNGDCARYYGPNFQATEESDYFDQRFGRRPNKKMIVNAQGSVRPKRGIKVGYVLVTSLG